MPPLFQLDTSFTVFLNTLVSTGPILSFTTRLIGIGGIFILFFFGALALVDSIPGLNVSGPFLFIQMLLTGVSAWVVNNLIGAFWFRERPYVQYPNSITPLIDIPLIAKSFPSDHASLAMALAVVVTLYLPKAGIPFMVLALLIGVFRIAAGVHFFTDVLVGFILGTVIALIVHKIFV